MSTMANVRISFIINRIAISMHSATTRFQMGAKTYSYPPLAKMLFGSGIDQTHYLGQRFLAIGKNLSNDYKPLS